MAITQRDLFDKERQAHEQMHVRRPPRLEGKVRNAMMYSARKPRRDRKSGAKLLATLYASDDVDSVP